MELEEVPEPAVDVGEADGQLVGEADLAGEIDAADRHQVGDGVATGHLAGEVGTDRRAAGAAAVAWPRFSETRLEHGVEMLGLQCEEAEDGRKGHDRAQGWIAQEPGGRHLSNGSLSAPGKIQSCPLLRDRGGRGRRAEDARGTEAAVGPSQPLLDGGVVVRPDGEAEGVIRVVVPGQVAQDGRQLADDERVARAVQDGGDLRAGRDRLEVPARHDADLRGRIKDVSGVGGAVSLPQVFEEYGNPANVLVDYLGGPCCQHRHLSTYRPAPTNQLRERLGLVSREEMHLPHEHSSMVTPSSTDCDALSMTPCVPFFRSKYWEKATDERQKPPTVRCGWLGPPFTHSIAVRT
ncbi:hypothetical protein VTK73DRAFT_10211 [Phialemonium thermophilum]|uniref:Uncharacterized protein n=1 Tax=Phialemonium thermophilum TaxID=223376 RepID=A0ABR3VY11_9PEZI